MLPADVDPMSRCRLPLVKREALDEEGQRQFDVNVDPNGGTLRGLIGPGGIQLHSSHLAALARPVNRYLRFETGFSPYRREVAVLITARECDSAFEWAAHEPEALKQGVPQAVIDVIKFRRPTAGLPAEDALIIALGREIFGTRKVSSQTYAKALAHFGQKGLVDLVSLMGNYAATAALLCAFDMQVDDDATALLPA